MWKRYLMIVIGLTAFIVVVRSALRPDYLAHGSWQIITENFLLMPGLFIIGPICPSPEGPVIAKFCYWAIMVIAAIVYAIPVLIVINLLKKIKSGNNKN